MKLKKYTSDQIQRQKIFYLLMIFALTYNQHLNFSNISPARHYQSINWPPPFPVTLLTDFPQVL